MSFAKKKGYRAERKIRILLEQKGWSVTRAGGSLGEADLIALKNRACMLLQIKSTGKKTLYYYGYMKKLYQGFKFYLIVDFGYGRIRILHPKRAVTNEDGTDLKEFLNNH